MRLGLGTVQLGADYGVTNARGRVPEREVAPMLELAARAGIDILDTAAQYGDSEAVIGRSLRAGHPFKLVTKTAPNASALIGEAEIARTREAFHRSLERLRMPRVHGLLVHHASELLRPGGDALAGLLRALRSEGLVSKVGFSCYTPGELEAASAVLRPDIVQVPCNVLDQRFAASTALAALRSAGSEVHARSLFLQGLLLVPPAELPPRFAPHIEAFVRVERCARDHGLAPRELVLGYAAQCAAIDVGLVGVSSLAELRQIVETFGTLRTKGVDYAALRYDDERLLNPSLWPALAPAHAAAAAQ